MNRPTEPVGSDNRTRFRMDTGLDVLEAWAASATQSEKNAVYKALFAVSDGSVFTSYRTMDDWLHPSELFVFVKPRLVLKIRVNCFDSFGPVYIGPREGAPGLGQFGVGFTP